MAWGDARSKRTILSKDARDERQRVFTAWRKRNPHAPPSRFDEMYRAAQRAEMDRRKQGDGDPA
jgi:hypothetical protein